MIVGVDDEAAERQREREHTLIEECHYYLKRPETVYFWMEERAATKRRKFEILYDPNEFRKQLPTTQFFSTT